MITVEEIDSQINEWKGRLNEITPAFLYDAEDEAAELSEKIETAQIHREMLIEMQREGVISDRQ